MELFVEPRFGMHVDQASGRAESLLLEHLTPEQLRAYRERGSIAVV